MWEDERNGWRDIYAQRLDSNGFKMWDSLGVSVAIKATYKFVGGIISDGSGGAIIAWNDIGDFPANPADVYVQHLDSSGLPLWDSGGVAIANSPASELFGSMVLDVTGGVYVSYVNVDSLILFTQHLDQQGNFLWGNPPPKIGIFLTPDNHGGFIALSGNRVQRYDSLAQPLWGDTALLYTTRNTSQVDKGFVSDGSEGVMVTWLDYDGAFNYDVYVQRVDSLGNRLWGDEGVLVGTQANSGTFAPFIATDTRGGAIIGWNWPGSGLGFVSRISKDGTTLWGPEGIADTGYVWYVVTDLMGGAIYNRSQFFAQHLDSTGQALWGSQGLKVTTRNVEGSFAPISDGKGGTLIYWDEWDIYCQWIDKDGNLGGKTDVEEGEQNPLIPRQLTLYQNYPNPFNNSTQIRFSTSKIEEVTLKIYNVSGRLVKVVLDDVLKGTGQHTVFWDGTDYNGKKVASGIYLYLITTKDWTQARKMTLLK